MALLTCDDCGGQVSDQATACPSCGKPTGVVDLLDPRACPNCERYGIVTGSGVHGAAEIAATIAMTLLFFIPGLIVYFYLSARPWCEACHTRPPDGSVSPWSLWVLVGLVTFLAYAAIA